MLNQSLSIGIISGVISSLLIAFFAIIYKEVFLPRIKRFFYSGIDLAGEWRSQGYSDKGYSWQSTINIIHRGPSLHGDIVINTQFDSENREDVIHYLKFKGEVYNGRIMISYKPKSNKNMDSGVYYFTIVDSGHSLIGASIFTNNSTNYNSDNEWGYRIDDNIKYTRI